MAIANEIECTGQDDNQAAEVSLMPSKLLLHEEEEHKPFEDDRT